MRKIKNLRKVFFLVLYYSLLRYLPRSNWGKIGFFCMRLRYFCCKMIFEQCGNNVNIERKAYFGSGRNLQIGDHSGLGVNCHVPSDIIIGKYVMMGPEVFVLDSNHNIDRIDIPMMFQGHQERKRTIIQDDVWIGRQVIFTPGRIVSKGSVIAAGSVVTKDYPEYSIIGGNPAKIIRSRK